MKVFIWLQNKLKVAYIKAKPTKPLFKKKINTDASKTVKHKRPS